MAFVACETLRKYLPAGNTCQSAGRLELHRTVDTVFTIMADEVAWHMIWIGSGVMILSEINNWTCASHSHQRRMSSVLPC